MFKVYLQFILFLMLCSLCLQANEQRGRVMYYYTVDIVGTDTIINATLPQVTILPQLQFNNEKDWKEYAKLVRDVKKTLPYAIAITRSIIETYEFMETLPDQKAKDKHLKEAQRYIQDEYKPKMKKLTKNQGKILVKLINRQTNSSAYEITKAIMGPLKASFFNTLAGIYGNNLKTQYEPEGKDQVIERIIIEIRQGTL